MSTTTNETTTPLSSAPTNGHSNGTNGHSNGTNGTNGTTNGSAPVRDPRTRKYWTIDGEVYDLSCFLDPKHPNYFKHPGGTLVIEETRGLDVTFYFHSYHFKITPDLSKYKVEGIPPYVTPFSCDMKKDDPLYAEIKQAVREEFRGKPTKPSYFRCSWVIALSLVTIYLYLAMLKGQWIGLLSVFTYWVSIGGCFHDQEHFAFSRRPFVKFLVDLYGAWFIDPPTWRAVHNYTHHVYTNILDYDADLAHNHKTHRSIPNARYKKHFSYQMYYYFLMLPFLVFPIRFLHTLLFILSKRLAHKVPRNYKIPVFELTFFTAVKIALFVVMCIRPFYLFGFWKALLFASWFPVLFSMHFMLFSQINHLTETSTRELSTKQWSARTWSEHQIITSTNWGTFKDSYSNSLEDWSHWIWAQFWFLYGIGLNYQIEHHLFPSINHEHLPRIAPIVKRICAKHGVRYNDIGSFSGAVVAHVTHLWRMSKKPTDGLKKDS